MNPLTGAMVEIRALLDSGADITMLNRQTAQQIGLTGKKINICIAVAGGGTIARCEKEVAFQLVSRDKSFVSTPMVALTTESVGNPFKAVDFRPSKHSHLKDLELADKFPSAQERPFQLIISEPYFSSMKKGNYSVSEDPSLPTAKLTALGSILRGALGISRQIEAASAFGLREYDHESFDVNTIYNSLNFDFAKFWNGENIGISQSEPMTSDLTALEIRAEEHHRQTSKFDPVKKQWTVRLPWIDPDPKSHQLSDNLRRAKAMVHKVHSTVKAEHLPMVNDAYIELVTQGFAEEIPLDEMNPEHLIYYLTSRPVIRINASSTKCRIVINGSLPDQNDKAKSLNKMLMPGPNKLPQIMGALTKTHVQEAHLSC